MYEENPISSLPIKTREFVNTGYGVWCDQQVLGWLAGHA